MLSAVSWLLWNKVACSSHFYRCFPGLLQKWDQWYSQDCWYFAAAFLFVRILLFIIFTLTQTVLFYGVALLVFILLVMVIVTVQPYKPRFSTYNAMHSVLVLLMALCCATAVCIIIAELKADQVQRVFLLLAFIFELPPLF